MFTNLLSIHSGNCESNTRLCQVHESIIKHRHILMQDMPETNILEYFPEICRFIHAAMQSGLQTGRKATVLVHCRAGISRSASAVIAYLMWVQHMSYWSARSHLEYVRPCVRPNIGFVTQLQLWEILHFDLTGKSLTAYDLSNERQRFEQKNS